MTPLSVAILMIALGAVVACYGGWFLITRKHRHTGLALLLGGAAVAFVAAVAQPHAPTQEPTQAAPVPLDEYYEQCVAKCEENVPN